MSEVPLYRIRLIRKPELETPKLVSVFVFVCLSVCLPICLSVCLSVSTPKNPWGFHGAEVEAPTARNAEL